MSDDKFEMNEGQCFVYNVKAEGNKPTVKGKAKIDGTEYEISLWPSKSGKAGSYSGKIALPFKPQKQGGAKETGHRNDMDDEIPF